MKLYVVRHATTTFNEKGTINSRYDDNLSETGKKQIPELVKKTEDLKFSKIYCSSLRRAIDTAEPIAKKHDLEITVDDRITEINFGELTGKTADEMIALFGLTATELLNSYAYDFSEFEGETSEQVRNRVQDFVDFLKKQNEDVMIVTHSGIIRWLYYLLNKETVGSFPNASIHEFNISN